MPGIVIHRHQWTKHEASVPTGTRRNIKQYTLQVSSPYSVLWDGECRRRGGKVEQGEGDGWSGVTTFNRMVKVSLLLKVTSESQLETDEGNYDTDILGESMHPEERKSQVTLTGVPAVL